MESVPAVSCKSCARTWNSATMAEGLHLLGACPRCGGDLEFAAPAATDDRDSRTVSADDSLAPHLVLGIPRR